MKLVQFLAAVLMAGFISSHVTAQVNTTGVMSSPNLVNVTNQQGTGWVGTVPYTGTGGGYSGGSTPGYNAETNTIHFGYTTKTAAYTYALNQALRDSGMTILGYNYSWNYLNQNPYNGTLSAAVNFTGTNGSNLHSKTWALGATTDWTTVSGTETFANNGMAVSSIANFSLSFTGKDSRFWAGYYGPQVRDPSIRLNYTVDPCVANPLYSPSCSGYNNVLTSQNITAQSYAINQALNLSGAGVQINGLEYGYHYYVGGDWCSATFLGIFCTKWDQSSMDVNVNVTSSTGSSIYSATHSHGPNTSGTPSYSYVFPTQRLLSTMGEFSLSTNEVGTTALYSSWSRWQYTPDPCVVNPLSSTTCDGYAVAFKTQQCTANPLYAADCPGYAVAFKTQQCTANALYDTTCPGYANAYLTYQCSLNPLYSTTCQGYEAAYFDQQCSLNSLYSNRCPNYASAYKAQQCSLDSLYATDCPNYASAYKAQQCSLNALYATDCPGYAAAYFSQQCNLNGLYDRTCPNYSEAYAKKMLLEQQGLASTVATAGVIASTAPSPTSTTASTTSASTTVSSDGSVSTGVSKTGDTNIDKAIAQPAPTTNSAAAPSAPVQLVQAPPPAAAPMAPAPAGKNEGGGKQENKPEPAGGGPSGGGPAPQMAQGQQGGDSKPAQPTTREALAERRQAAARAEAVERGKNVANEMGQLANLESQKQMQNIVIQAMGYTPGFDAYGKAMIQDVAGYKPFTVYNNQRNIENRATLRMFGGTDRLHNEMVDSQYNKGK